MDSSAEWQGAPTILWRKNSPNAVIWMDSLTIHEGPYRLDRYSAYVAGPFKSLEAAKAAYLILYGGGDG